jgi:hypothetical protein
MKLLVPCLLAATLSVGRAAITPSTPATGERQDPAGVEFFERNIRPVLVQKCYGCHSAESGKQKGGLSLDTREAIRLGGESGHAVVPGDPGESILMKALRYEDTEMQMPPKKEGGKLPDNVIAHFEQWIRMGAPDPRAGTITKMVPVAKKEWDLKKAKEFWAFQPPKAVPPPALKDKSWPRSDVDRYILGALEGKGLKPVADADKTTLMRRVYFDLIGLPPRPDEVEAFVNDKSPKAFEKIVDRLLASPQFGERWGRHWLDVARYAESTGKERNFTFPAAWRYRDYVIAAFNADTPYTQFVKEQVAGDLLPHSGDAERNRHMVATGFLALGPKGLNEKNKQQFSMDLVDEQVDATTRAFLGITVACARCHDHKFDPIPQKEYYSLAGIFRSSETYYGTAGGKNRNGSSLLPLAGTAPVTAAPASATPSMTEIESRLQQYAAGNPQVAARLARMTAEQKAQAFEKLQVRQGGAAPATQVAPPPSTPQSKKAALAANKKSKKKKGKGYSSPSSTSPGAEVCMGVLEGKPTDLHILIRGEIDQPADLAPRGFVTVLSSGKPPEIAPESSGRRELAEWLTTPSNPLTARVAVNRIWLHLFGQGIVRSADNFGATGEKPSNPALLDALALQFMRDGWSTKRMIRSLVLSHVYQLSSSHDPRANEIDPDNILLWRASPRRLDAEAIRDAMLACGGQLDVAAPKGSLVSTIGDGYIGKGIRPESFTDYESKKRSVYLPVVRDFVPEVLDVFDFAEPSLVVASRDVTNVPSQALFMMNNDFVREQSTAMARRVLASPLDYSARVSLAYQIALNRRPSDAERARASAYLLDEATALVPLKAGDKDEAALLSWSTFCQALFASAEFRYLR